MTDLDLLTDAARRSGEIASGFFNQDPEVWHKDDNAGPVTEADFAVDKMLRETLTAARPDYGWLSEETEDTVARQDTQTQFIIDPIDGTRAFIEGSKDWAHSLAITQDGIATAAAIYIPQRDLMFTAELGQGAHLNGAPIAMSDTTDLDRSDILAARPNYDAKNWAEGQIPTAKRSFRSSLAYRLCLVAQGSYDAMLSLRPTWEWDIAAGALIVTEAGGTVTDRKGEQLRFNNPHPQTNGIVAANAALHSQITDRLA